MFTFVVIGCNRLHYLKNCVDSIIEFVGLEDIDLLVIDNGSSEKGTKDYLSSLPRKIITHRFEKRSNNELHRAMNHAIQFSIDKGNQYINFIQDDYQYIYEQPKLLSWVTAAFEKHNNVIQLQTNLIWKYKKNKIGKISSVDVAGVKWYLFHDKFPCDNGFTRVSVYKQFGFYPTNTSVHGSEVGFVSGESWFAKKCAEKRYKRMLLSLPNLGMVPNCAYIRGKHRYGKYYAPIGRYYIEPFDKNRQDQLLKLSDRNELCFMEDIISDNITKHSQSTDRTKV